MMAFSDNIVAAEIQMNAGFHRRADQLGGGPRAHIDKVTFSALYGFISIVVGPMGSGVSVTIWAGYMDAGG